MSQPRPHSREDERLPMLLGFQRVTENTAAQTRAIEHGRGIYVYDADGREYIEATASFYVAALGYQNAELIDAIEELAHMLIQCLHHFCVAHVASMGAMGWVRVEVV